MPSRKTALTRHRNYYVKTQKPEDAPNVVLGKIRAEMSQAFVMAAMGWGSNLLPGSHEIPALQAGLIYGADYTSESLPDMQQQAVHARGFLAMLGEGAEQMLLPSGETMPMISVTPDTLATVESIGIQLADMAYLEITRGRSITNAEGVETQSAKADAQAKIDYMVACAREQGVQNIDPFAVLGDIARRSGLNLGQHMQEIVMPALLAIRQALATEGSQNNLEGLDSLLRTEPGRFYRSVQALRSGIELPSILSPQHLPADHQPRRSQDYVLGTTPSVPNIGPGKECS